MILKENINIEKFIKEMENAWLNDDNFTKKQDHHFIIKNEFCIINIYPSKNKKTVKIDVANNTKGHYLYPEIEKLEEIAEKNINNKINYQFSMARIEFEKIENEFFSFTKSKQELVDSFKKGEQIKLFGTISFRKYSNKVFFQGLFCENYNNIINWLDNKKNCINNFLEENKELIIGKILTEPEKDEQYWIKELKKKLPKSNRFLGDKLIAIMSSAMFLYDSNVKFCDYSLFSNPVLRGLEGYIKKICQIQDLIDDGAIKKKFSELFDFESGSAKIKTEHKITFSSTQIKALEDSINFYNKYRHKFVHIDNIPETSNIITTKTACIELIEKTLRLIEEVYHEEFHYE